MGCLHDSANVQQTSSKCIQNTRVNAGRLLWVCWTFARSCKHPLTFFKRKSSVIDYAPKGFFSPNAAMEQLSSAQA